MYIVLVVTFLCGALLAHVAGVFKVFILGVGSAMTFCPRELIECKAKFNVLCLEIINTHHRETTDIDMLKRF